MAKRSSYQDDFLRHLKDPEFAAEYLIAALDENDEEFLQESLALLIKVHGYTKISEETGIARQAIYKMLSGEGNPSFQNINKLRGAIGLEFIVRTKKKKRAS